jgi:hypothetical protein
MTTTPPALASKPCAACRELPAKCRCQRIAEAHPDPVAAPTVKTQRVARKANAPQPAAPMVGDAGSPWVLPAEVQPLAQEHAERVGLAPGEWLARAARAFAKVPATAAERMRASRERQRAARIAAPNKET